MPPHEVVASSEFLSLTGLTKSLVERERSKKQATHANNYNIAPRFRYFGNSQLALSTCDGQKRHHDLNTALEDLDKKGYPRSPQQMAMHKAYTVACFKNIYGSDLEAHLVRLVKQYQITELRNDVIVLTPRRYGKTMSVGLYVAAYIMTQPKADVSIYSTGRRASKKLLVLIWKLCCTLYGSPEACVGLNQEELKVRCMNGGITQVGSFPSKESVRLYSLSANTSAEPCPTTRYAPPRMNTQEVISKPGSVRFPAEVASACFMLFTRASSSASSDFFRRARMSLILSSTFSRRVSSKSSSPAYSPCLSPVYL